MPLSEPTSAAIPPPVEGVGDRRFQSIDGLRGLAALEVTLFHLFGHALSPTGALAAVRQLTDYGWVGVPIFFVISGFVIVHSMRGARITWGYAGNYALRRAIRLDPPYWTAIAVSILLSYTIARLTSEPWIAPSGQQLLAHVFYLQNLLGFENLSGGLWTLCLEVQFYATCLLLMAICQKTGAPLAALVLPIACVSLGLSPIAVSEADLPLVFDAYRSLLPNFDMFAIGMLTWLVSMNQLPRWGWWLAMTVVALRLLFWFHLELLAALVAGWVIFTSVRRPPWLLINPVVQFLGRISYSLYLIHQAVGRVTLLALRKLLHIEAYDSLLCCLLATAVAIAAAYVMNLCVEQPSVNLARRLKGKPANTKESLKVARENRA